MRILHSQSFLLAAACVLAAASGAFWVFFSGTPGLGTASPPTRQTSPPDSDDELSFAETDIDLGLIKQATKHEVEFTNRSDRVVRIGKIQTSCNCTTTQPDRKSLQPGETARILLSVEPRTDRVGLSRHLITIEYEGKVQRQAHLQIHYQTRPDVVVTNQMTLRCLVGQESSGQFTLVDYRDKPLRIERITTSSENIRARVTEAPSSYLPGWQYCLEASYSGSGRPPGDYAETLTLHTSDPDRETIPVRVSGHQVSRIRVAPKILQLKSEPEAADFVGRVYLDDTEGAAVEVQAVDPSHDGLHCRVVASDGPAPRTVEVRIRKEDLGRLPRPASVRLTVTKPTSEVVCIPIAP